MVFFLALSRISENFPQVKFPYGTISSAQPDLEDDWVWYNNFDYFKIREFSLIYDINGQLLKELVNEMQEPGEYSVNYAPGKTNASGIYFYELVSGSFRTMRKALFVK
ncbi:MAG: hypothetical protein IT279_12580 [Ignavibacteriaceae bacterium]|nr:hypothetical protein [Ignavibacteriaceae bacterium]